MARPALRFAPSFAAFLVATLAGCGVCAREGGLSPAFACPSAFAPSPVPPGDTSSSSSSSSNSMPMRGRSTSCWIKRASRRWI